MTVLQLYNALGDCKHPRAQVRVGRSDMGNLWIERPVKVEFVPEMGMVLIRCVDDQKVRKPGLSHIHPAPQEP